VPPSNRCDAKEIALWTTVRAPEAAGRLSGMDNDPMPPRLPPGQAPPIRTQHDLRQYWRALMGPLGFSQPLLWLSFVAADGRPTPVLSQIDDLPELPDDHFLGNLMLIAEGVIGHEVPGGSLAVLLSRPGRADLTDSDRAWARGLTTAALEAGVRMRPVHLANDEEVRIVAPDDLIPARIA